MLRSLCLTNFKGFQDEAFALGSFTLLIGTNAAGKSNLRDALMCLHAVGRGYAIPEALGERYEAGVRVWPGIRGGARGAARHGSSQFSLMTRTDFDGARALTHDLTLGVAAHGPASVTAETLWWIDDHVPLLETQPKSKAHELRCLVRADDRGNRIQLDFPASNSALTTLASPYGVARWGLAGRNLDEVNAVADDA
ncbi:MAG: hypothetical protein KC613_16540, partial [Myxococcales bacterium]|nr:hypothetical protein [Myxococcales bacterium]